MSRNNSQPANNSDAPRGILSDEASAAMETANISQSELKVNGILVQELGTLAQACADGLGATPRHLRKLLQRAAWREFITPTNERVTYAADEFDNFVAAPAPKGLGMTIAVLLRICRAMPGDDAEAASRLIRELLLPANRHGGLRSHNQSNNVTLSRPNMRRGNSAEYKLRRLKRDEPQLAEAVIKGHRSVHDAAVEAGFARRALQLPDDPVKAAKKVAVEKGTEWASALRCALRSIVPVSDSAVVDSAPGEEAVDAKESTHSPVLAETIHIVLATEQGEIHATLPGEWLIAPTSAVNGLNVSGKRTGFQYFAGRLSTGIFIILEVPPGGRTPTVARLFGSMAHANHDLPRNVVHAVEHSLKGRS
jgi:hypothetical protein